MVWCNTPFSSNVMTNLGKRFFGILNKHFPENSELAKIFNKNRVKLSYSCMPNMQSNISGHNKKILRGEMMLRKNVTAGVEGVPVHWTVDARLSHWCIGLRCLAWGR